MVNNDCPTALTAHIRRQSVRTAELRSTARDCRSYIANRTNQGFWFGEGSLEAHETESRSPNNRRFGEGLTPTKGMH